MNTLYITETGRISLDENNNPQKIDTVREAIDRIMHLKEDTTIVYNKNGNKKTLSAKAGDIIVTFYEGVFPNPIIVVSSEEWEENLNAYEAKEQKAKEEWAAKNLSEVMDPSCSKCDECEGTCSN